MPWFTVMVKIERESEFDITIEADSEVDAEDVVKGRLWNDEYSQEERATSTIVDEHYSAEEEIDDCEDCGEPREDCICEDETDDYKGYNRRKSEWESARGLIEEDKS